MSFHVNNVIIATIITIHRVNFGLVIYFDSIFWRVLGSCFGLAL